MLIKNVNWLFKSQILKRNRIIRSSHANNASALIDVHPEVQKSLQRGRPVVALESTIITHGMPHPNNYETACEVEELVRAQGAVPATIAIMGGRIKVGLSNSELQSLAAMQRDEVFKCSRRDLPFVIAQKHNGGTTVAATMLIAQQVGVHIFATGGIGGVHREGHVSMDVSADLVELGRTPVTVVCSGIKSILDIPRTLEYLETQGVCVASYGSDEGRFPDFYTRDSGCKVPYNLQGPADAARLIKALHALKLQSGILIGVPIPAEYAADKQLIDAAIEQAYAEANAQGVNTGKEVTPFLLAAIAKITKGNSLQANIALIKNNATVAAQIAREMCALPTNYHQLALSNEHTDSQQVDSQVSSAPLVIGASILDLCLTILDELPTTLNGATYRTQSRQYGGGVGRNLAEGIFKLHGKANFISAVGNDDMGKSLMRLIPKPLQACVQQNEQHATSICSVIFDRLGDCKLILGNMDIHSSITPQHVQQNEQLVQNAPLIVFDANLVLPTIESILKLSMQHRRPVFFEPTDMRIAGKPFALPRHLTQQIRIVSPNLHELKTMVECMTESTVQWNPDMSESTANILQKSRELLMQIQEHFDCILVTLGHHGVLVSLPRAAFQKPLFDAQSGEYAWPLAKLREGDDGQQHIARFFAAPKVERLANVSGAGDSFSSGFITGLLRGYEVERCVALGFMAAQRALQSDSAVPCHYFNNESEETKALYNLLKCLDTRDI